MEAVAIEENFVFCYESNMTASYLVAKAPDKNMIQHYQVEMMVNNHITGILPFNMKNRDGEALFYYDIISRLPLSYFIKRGVKRNNLINILASIAKTLICSRDYLLQEGNFIFNVEYIFLNPSTLEAYMAYLPVKKAGNALERFKELVAHIVTNSTYTAECCSDNFLQKILSYLKRENFNIVEFRNFLRDLNRGDGSEKEFEEKVPLICEDKDTEARIDKHTKDTWGNKLASILRFKASRIVLGMLLQIPVISAVAAGSALLKPLNDDPVAVYAGTGIVAAALDLLILRKVFDKKYMIVKKSVEKTLNSKDGDKLKKEIQRQRGGTGLESTSEKKNDLPAKGRNDTVLLGPSADGRPCLRCIKDGIVEEISISGKEFVIGRLKEQVDYATDNNAVGKVHAVVTVRDGEYFIKDLNSRNGTFVNNTRLESNKDYNIKNNDRIRLANRDYIFTFI